MNELTNQTKPCSIWRWIILAAISIAAMLVFYVIAEIGLTIGMFSPGGTFGSLYSTLTVLISFGAAFWAMVFLMKPICRMPVKEFILGRCGKNDIKLWLKIAGLFVLGMIISMIVLPGKVELNDLPMKVILMNLVVAIVLTWMQTSAEEFWFRGMVIRYFGKGECRFTKKLVIAGIIASLIFMCGHLGNSEVTSQTGGSDIVCAAMIYFLAGFMLYFLDLCFGNLMPGLIIHAINNFIAFAIVSSDNSTLGTNTFFISPDMSAAVTSLISTAIGYLPVTIYGIIYYKKHRAKAAECKDFKA